MLILGWLVALSIVGTLVVRLVLAHLSERRWKRKEQSDPACQCIIQALQQEGPMSLIQLLAHVQDPRGSKAVLEALAICLVAGSIRCNSVNRTYMLNESGGLLHD